MKPTTELNTWQKSAIKELLELVTFIVSGVMNDPGELANRLRQIAFSIDKYNKNK